MCNDDTFKVSPKILEFFACHKFVKGNIYPTIIAAQLLKKMEICVRSVMGAGGTLDKVGHGGGSQAHFCLRYNMTA